MPVSAMEIKTAVASMAHIIVKHEVHFCQLDSAAGDGDFGMSLAKGFKEVLNSLPSMDTDDIGVLLNDCAMIIYEHCGGASGPIWGSGFKAAARSAMGKASLSDDGIAELFVQAIAGIQKKGGAQIGDKTLLDALIPFASALKEQIASQAALSDAFQTAAAAARAGAEQTRLFVAKKGRATYVVERSISHPDAGAIAIAVIAEEMIGEKK